LDRLERKDLVPKRKGWTMGQMKRNFILGAVVAVFLLTVLFLRLRASSEERAVKSPSPTPTMIPHEIPSPFPPSTEPRETDHTKAETGGQIAENVSSDIPADICADAMVDEFVSKTGDYGWQYLGSEELQSVKEALLSYSLSWARISEVSGNLKILVNDADAQWFLDTDISMRIRDTELNGEDLTRYFRYPGWSTMTLTDKSKTWTFTAEQKGDDYTYRCTAEDEELAQELESKLATVFIEIWSPARSLLSPGRTTDEALRRRIGEFVYFYPPRHYDGVDDNGDSYEFSRPPNARGQQHNVYVISGGLLTDIEFHEPTGELRCKMNLRSYEDFQGLWFPTEITTICDQSTSVLEFENITIKCISD